MNYESFLVKSNIDQLILGNVNEYMIIGLDNIARDI